MTYEYVCTNCGHSWEAEQSISAAPLKVCPNCGQENAKRQVSGGAGFILKGGGWYADGYGSSKGSGSSGSGSSGGGSTTASKTESSSESKSATPTSDSTKTTDSKGAAASTS